LSVNGDIVIRITGLTKRFGLVLAVEKISLPEVGYLVMEVTR
jgi:hypothetical protein